jgi:Xaa-Pro aminopeptidase
MDLSPSLVLERLQAVRAVLRQHGFAALVVLSSDPHLSEYLPERWQSRQWLSGFTGSAGSLVVTLEKAALFADSRYWVQAQAELGSGPVDLVKTATGEHTDHIDWLAQHTVSGERISIDAQVFGMAAAQRLQRRMLQHGVVIEGALDVVGLAWPERPALPSASIFEHDLAYACVSRAQKLAQVRAAMHQHGAGAHFISTLDDIAWLLNLRGADVDHNPVFLGHVLLTLDSCTLFVGSGKLTPALEAALQRDGVQLQDYALAHHAVSLCRRSPPKILLDPQRVTLGCYDAWAGQAEVVEAVNPSTLLKSRKTPEQAAHIRSAMRQDGAAMCEFYAWLEQALVSGESVSEITVDQHLSAARARRPGFMGLSFATIAGFNANGAMPHYRATPQSHAQIVGDGLLLIDSGGQYLGGTTDVTRVWPIGQVTEAQKRDYTLVLKGTLALSRARFPRGTPSPMLDALARAPLWQHGLDYGHGTGHGVGYFLNVHEGPQSISKALAQPQMAMQLGMVTSVEPGLYRPGQWGIRIENLVLNVVSTTSALDSHGEPQFLEFETLTLCPIDTRCIALDLLNREEIAWLNSYHVRVRAALGPLVSGAARDWLECRTEAIIGVDSIGL